MSFRTNAGARAKSRSLATPLEFAQGQDVSNLIFFMKKPRLVGRGFGFSV